MLLCARKLGVQHDLAMPSVAAIVSSTGASRSRAYGLAQELFAMLPRLCRKPGRPSIEATPAPTSVLDAVRTEALRFVMSHPGCVRLGPLRARYSEDFRLFVVALRERHLDAPLVDLADALLVPLGTIEDWLRTPGLDPPCDADSRDPRSVEAESDSVEAESDAKHVQIQIVLDAWRTWSGDFTSFCEHVRRDHRLPLGRTIVANLLFEHGERLPTRRAGRSRDEHALRGSFETFFPGAQWVGDGKALEVTIDGRRFVVNLELVVDASSGASVGIAVRDEEDSESVIDAFHEGARTTGQPPIALLLDNRPSNHTPDIDEAIGETMRMRATPERPQNKAHVEGQFGLFSQKVPPIVLDTSDPQALARTLAKIVATTFFRALNRAPRQDRDARTRADLYATKNVTPEQLEAAREALRERMRKLELARQTRVERLDPVLRAMLDDAFERLALLDPERRVRDAIAGYSRDAIVDSVAIFAGKRARAALPEGVDARYLLGIVRNVHHRHESDVITDALLRERLAARDRFLDPLVHERNAILANATDVTAILDALVARLVNAERAIDFRFWIEATANLLAPQVDDEKRESARRAARRIHGAFRLDARERDQLVRSLFRRLWPLE